jgi:hypothetical protein
MDERRASPRLTPRTRTTVRVICADPVDSQAALVWDLCAGGVRLLTARPLPSSGLVLLDVPGVEVVGARVQHAAEQPDGTWLAGCALLGRFNPDDLQRLATEGGGLAGGGTTEGGDVS